MSKSMQQVLAQDISSHQMMSSHAAAAVIFSILSQQTSVCSLLFAKRLSSLVNAAAATAILLTHFTLVLTKNN